MKQHKKETAKKPSQRINETWSFVEGIKLALLRISSFLNTLNLGSIQLTKVLNNLAPTQLANFAFDLWLNIKKLAEPRQKDQKRFTLSRAAKIALSLSFLGLSTALYVTGILGIAVSPLMLVLGGIGLASSLFYIGKYYVDKNEKKKMSKDTTLSEEKQKKSLDKFNSLNTKTEHASRYMNAISAAMALAGIILISIAPPIGLGLMAGASAIIASFSIFSLIKKTISKDNEKAPTEENIIEEQKKKTDIKYPHTESHDAPHKEARQSYKPNLFQPNNSDSVKSNLDHMKMKK